MGTANYTGSANPDTSLSFDVPANCSKLWFVVSGAPQEHWHHEWDDNNSNDEQWPYQVRFSNTNLIGQATDVQTVASINRLSVNPVIVGGIINLQSASRWTLTTLSGKVLLEGVGIAIDMRRFSNGSYILNHSGRSMWVVKSSAKSVLF